MGIVYYDGNFLPETEALIPITDRGFQHGDGAYATIQLREGVPLFFKAHYLQLQEQCQAFNLLMPPFEEEIVAKLIEHNRAFEGIWRMKVFVTGGDSLENRLPERSGRLLITLKPFVCEPFKPLTLGIFPIPYWSCHASFKSLAHLNRYYVTEEAYKQGVDDCVTFTETGTILEASFGNLIWVKERSIFTPDPSLPIYFGITVQNVLAIAQKEGFKLEYIKATLSEIPTDATVFRTNSMQGVRPVAQIGDRPLALNQTLQTLFVNGYEKLIHNEIRMHQQKKVALMH